MKFAKRLVTGALLGSLGEKSVFESRTPTCCKLKSIYVKTLEKIIWQFRKKISMWPLLLNLYWKLSWKIDLKLDFNFYLMGVLFLMSEEVKSRHPKITYADLYQVIMVLKKSLCLIYEFLDLFENHRVWHSVVSVMKISNKRLDRTRGARNMLLW